MTESLPSILSNSYRQLPVPPSGLGESSFKDLVSFTAVDDAKVLRPLHIPPPCAPFFPSKHISGRVEPNVCVGTGDEEEKGYFTRS